MKFNVIDLFCGAGGLSLGFQQAGFNIIVGVDNEPVALETFEYNHKGSVALNAEYKWLKFCVSKTANK